MERIFYAFTFAESKERFISRSLQWGQDNYKQIALLNSHNQFPDPHGQHHSMLALGAIEQISPGLDDRAFDVLKDFSDQHQDWLFGFLSYDLKNQLENLTSKNPDLIEMPLLHFFLPQVVLVIKDNTVEIGLKGDDANRSHAAEMLQKILNWDIQSQPFAIRQIYPRVERSEYISMVQKLQNHIQKGDIYEANYCIEFYAENAHVNPAMVYLSLNKLSPSPFSCYYRLDDKYLMSSSPERFLAKRGMQLISQPIKGTMRRGKTLEEDEYLKTVLANDPKERSENVMIVDLVRNDLSHTAKDGSVRVEELCGIYTYPKVHQMISTIKSELRDDIHFVDAIKKAFPMGSMTGAPKIRAMQIIEECEATQRGLYSGAVGYISPEKDFDFNVVIRSILHNQEKRTVSFMAGSAITIGSKPVKEYEECILKARSMAQTLGADL